MPSFGLKSMTNLQTCHRDLQTVLHEAILYYDFSVVFGHRSTEVQFELYKKGRKLINDRWVVKQANEVVTFKDGTEKRSRHNFEPSKAVDIIPYPSGWSNKKEFYYMAGVIMTIAGQALRKGNIEYAITWGGVWQWKDLPHFQI